MIEQKNLADGIRILTLSTPGKVTTLSSAANAALAAAIDAALADDSVRGIVITSNKSDFAVGGDIDELLRCRTPADLEAIVAPFNAMSRRMETGNKPVVAALNGSALGGGFELALACHRRIAAQNDKARFGLPEAGLGLMPGAGGTQRLPRLIGLKAAADLILAGRTVDANTALQLGMIDDLVSPEHLLDAACAWLRTSPTPVQPWDAKGFKLRDFDPQSIEGRRYFAMQWARHRTRSAGTNHAATAILHTLHHGLQRTLEAGIAIETRNFSQLGAEPDAHNRIRTLFFGPREATANARAAAAAVSDLIATVGVVGGGVMGKGIAFAAARAGLGVVLIDEDISKAQAAREQIGLSAAKQVERGFLPAGMNQQIVERIIAGVDYSTLARCDIVIEAVFENIEVKHEVLRRASEATHPTVPIASNTSTFAIHRLAEAVEDPGRVIGMHFFAPAERMPLLEVIRAAKTSKRSLALALQLADRMKKTSIVVADTTGFYTSRIVSCYSGEALTMLAEGVPPAMIDNAAINLGMPMGPMALADLTKLDLLRDIMVSMKDAGPGLVGIRAFEALDALVSAGRTGRPANAGIFDYVDGELRAWSGISALFPPRDPALDLATIQDRLFYAQSLEAVRTLAEGVIDSPLAGDVAAVQGWGYPAHLGGVFGFIDTIGVAEFTRRAGQLARLFGERFKPPAHLRKMAREQRTFYDHAQSADDAA